MPVRPADAEIVCPTCRARSAVPWEIRQRAHAYQAALEATHSEQAALRAKAVAHAAQERVHRSSARGLKIFLGFSVVTGFLSTVPTVFLGLAQVASDASVEYEPWAVTLGALAIAVAAGVAVAGTICVMVGFWRMATRHRRRERASRNASTIAHHGAVELCHAICSQCGAPLAFRVGDHSITCGHCRATVMPSIGHQRRMVGIALERTELVRLEQARAQRSTLIAEMHRKRTHAMFMAWMVLGSLVCVALPFLALAYVWRTLSRSVEDRMLELSERLEGEFGAGREAVFAWLDACWVGDTPRGLALAPSGLDGLAGQIWSIESAYYARPILIVAQTNASDRTAKSLLILFARPMQRDASLVASALRTAAAQRIAALGFNFDIAHAGVVLEALDQRPAELTAERFTELAQAAYELAELRTPLERAA